MKYNEVLQTIHVPLFFRKCAVNNIHRVSRREIFGWAMFDFANSAYITVIVTVMFSVIFPNLIVGDAPEYRLGNLLWSIALSISHVLVIATAPIFGAIMDYTAAKKKFLLCSYLATVLFTACLYFVTPGRVWLGMMLVALSGFAFAVGESFISSFLPHLGTREELGKISGYAWGLGYIGGLVSTLLVTMLGPLSIDNFHNLRFVGPITALFFLLAAVPTFLWLREYGSKRPLPGGISYVAIGCRRLRQTLREIGDFRDMMTFLFAYFFAYSGLSIVISFTFIFGTQIVHWTTATRNVMFVLTQLTAALGAIVFGLLQDRLGTIKTFNITLLIWVVAIFLIYLNDPLTNYLNGMLHVNWQAQHVFLVIGSLAGLCLGATQSASRAMVGILSPASKAGEFYGFWALCCRTSAIVGLLTLGLLQTVFGLQKSILLCSLFFLSSFVVTFWVDQRRGELAAQQHEGE